MGLISEIKSSTGESLALIALQAKVFKTGSKGFFGMTKAEIDGKRYQVQVQLVEIGSKPKAQEG